MRAITERLRDLSCRRYIDNLFTFSGQRQGWKTPRELPGGALFLYV